MNQIAFLQSLDATLMTAFQGIGMGDVGTYTAPLGTPLPVRIYIDRNAQFFGDAGSEVVGNRITLGILRAGVARPERGATVVLTGTGESFTLQSLVEQDESLTRWVVLP